MKKILYQPLFINPQAYFVFPQLYHIEKGDSYIEPANITGQLIINNLSEGLTQTTTVNVYLMIGDKQYDAISGQLQTYSVSGSVKLEFLNMEEINNFAGTIKFTNVN